jgi:hypothetical protein
MEQLLQDVSKALRLLNTVHIEFGVTSSHPNQIVLACNAGGSPMFIERCGGNYRLYNEGSDLLKESPEWKIVLAEACSIFYCELMVGILDVMEDNLRDGANFDFSGISEDEY